MLVMDPSETSSFVTHRRVATGHSMLLAWEFKQNMSLAAAGHSHALFFRLFTAPVIIDEIPTGAARAAPRSRYARAAERAAVHRKTVVLSHDGRSRPGVCGDHGRTQNWHFVSSHLRNLPVEEDEGCSRRALPESPDVPGVT